MPINIDVFIGIDPGISGAIAYVNCTNLAQVEDMPKTPYGIYELLFRYRDECRGVGIEDPQPIPHQSVKAVATYWQMIGVIKGILVALGIPWKEVRPQDWRRRFGCTAKGKAAKSESIGLARELFPGVDLGRRMSAGRAEALLIAEHVRKLDKERYE